MYKPEVVWLFVAVAAVLRPGVADAADPQAMIDACRAADSAELRISCLERAILQDLVKDKQISDPALATASLPEEPSTAVESVEAPILAVIAQEPAPRAAPESAAVPSGSVVAAATNDSNATAEPSLVEDFGQEQVESRTVTSEKGSERFEVDVVAFDFVGRDKLRVRLKNGQVWKQQDSDRPNLYPALRTAKEFSVELWRNSRGSYRMRVPRANRVIRVERVE